MFSISRRHAMHWSMLSQQVDGHRSVRRRSWRGRRLRLFPRMAFKCCRVRYTLCGPLSLLPPIRHTQSTFDSSSASRWWRKLNVIHDVIPCHFDEYFPHVTSSIPPPTKLRGSKTTFIDLTVQWLLSTWNIFTLNIPFIFHLSKEISILKKLLFSERMLVVMVREFLTKTALETLCCICGQA